MPCVRFAIYIQPRASRTELAGMHAGAVKIRVTAAPVDNAANRALIELIAELLGVAKARVRILSGATGRRKLIEVEGITADVLASKFGPTVELD